MDFSEKFAEPEKWIKKINNDYGMQVMTWVGPLTFSDCDFPGLFPDSRNYIDLTNPMALVEFEQRLASNQYAVGIKGHKMDRADEHFPLTADRYEPTKEYSGPVKICQPVPVERIPVFIAKNSIYITGQIYQGNSKIWEGALKGKENLIIHLYPGEINENSQFTYVDYLDGNIEKLMTLQHQEGKVLFSSTAISIQSVVRVMIPEKPRKVFFGGKKVAFKYGKQNQIAEIACPKDHTIQLEIRY
ncbi:MAG TPA: hypothetical protein P5268_00050 [Candidatus Marinimicrobia bacterium]|nr:hypothetical protein [Candidatus Neomarinimicrobiota bacterium]HRS51351.1 hypothetical protein [Candidatus Neomarinimicrobiota bacterium]HRU91411.1 hypothetical protein [Candidatus Neomarinimicrobiota bacterium]